jgi:acyl carrier protein
MNQESIEDLSPRHNAAEIQQWLVGRLAKLLKADPSQIDVTKSFDRLGLDSATAVGVTLDLEDYLGRDVDPDMLYDHPTIEKLTEFLASHAPQADLPDSERGTSGS